MNASNVVAMLSVSLALATAVRAQDVSTGAAGSFAEAAAAAGGIATGFDTDGVPTFIWGTGQTIGAFGNPDLAARRHLERFARAFGMSPSELAAIPLVQLQQVASGGYIAHFRQQIGGLDVYGSDVKVLLGDDERLVAITGRPRSASGGAAQVEFRVSSEQAIAAALSDVSGVAVAPTSLVRTLPSVTDDPAAAAVFEWFQLVDPGRTVLAEPAPVKRMLFPIDGSLIAAYDVQFYAGTRDSNDSAAFRYVVAAADGRILERRDLTSSEQDPQQSEFQYRVWADPTGERRPHDGPQADFTPHPTGTPDDSEPPFVPADLISVSGLNHPSKGKTRGRFQVDFDRSGNGYGDARIFKADPWLAPDATETDGNNADAYVDHQAPDGLSAGDFRANTSSLRSFDWVYDTSADPLATVEQSKGAITQAFYTVNWLHDYWYDSGFNEAAGNAQRDNYGRGGLGGDAMRVEVQDNYFGGSRNNATMSTPADGIRPRMQMFVWTGRQTLKLTLMPGGERTAGGASFGPTSFDVTAPVALADDGAAPSTDGCEALVGSFTGRIVLVDRGTCTFVVKANNVQAAGGVGMIVANNVDGPPPALGGVDPTITIAVLSISQADGVALKASLAAGPVSARMFASKETDRDSGLDNQIIAHEFGHFVHHRLADCGTQQCRAMSEGWGDFLALHLTARDGDILDATYAVSVYAARGVADSGYYGIRRAPYSVDFSKNGLTFRHIQDGQPLPPEVLPGGPNSEVHNAGEVWASMLWESYVALLKSDPSATGFDKVRRRMSDYVVAGLQMTPRDATYTEQRDAILAAAVAGRHRSSDVQTIAEAFARRGAGSCAISPPRNSTNLVGVTESFDLKSRIVIGEVSFNDDQLSCDHDGYLDAGEQGRVAISVSNGGAVEALDTVITLTSATAGISFPRGNSVQIRRLRPFESVRVFIPIALASAVTGRGRLDLQVNVANGAACEVATTRSLAQWINVNEVPNASSTDDVEAKSTSWTIGGTNGPEVWSRVEAAPLNRAWLGADFSGVSDTMLESPDLRVSATGSLVMTFDHRHSFEVDGTMFFDGGVIEISLDGGVTWQDVSQVVDPGYGGTLIADSGNPLGGRRAFVARNAAWPARDTVSIDLGTGFAGQTVRVRFRIGTDAAVGDVGWELDNLTFSGITNTPFTILVDDTMACRPRHGPR
jgi:hypothetical protein